MNSNILKISFASSLLLMSSACSSYGYKRLGLIALEAAETNNCNDKPYHKSACSRDVKQKYNAMNDYVREHKDDPDLSDDPIYKTK